MYRILAPGHPRGWLDVATVCQDAAGRTLWIHSHGMERWKLPNLEIVGVPGDLGDYARGILFHVAGYMRSVRTIRPGESFGGRLVGPQQRARHQATLRPIDRPDDPAHSGFLRIVDFGEPATSGFPRRLFAVHLCALAEQAEDAPQRQPMYRQAISLWHGNPAAAVTEGAFEPGTNENNFLAWEGLGDALCDRGRFDQGILYLEEAVARCPRWARAFSQHVRTEYGPAQSEASDPRFTFWSQLDVAEVRQRVLERRGRLRPSSAGKSSPLPRAGEGLGVRVAPDHQSPGQDDDDPNPPRKPR